MAPRVTVPDADLKLVLLDALDEAAEVASEHLAHHALEHGVERPQATSCGERGGEGLFRVRRNPYSFSRYHFPFVRTASPPSHSTGRERKRTTGVVI